MEKSVIAGDVYSEFDAEMERNFLALAIHEVPLSGNEAAAICDACNGTILGCGGGWQSIWAEVEDANRLTGLGEKWEIDAVALSERIRESSFGFRYALSHAVQNFWRVCDLVAGIRESLEKAGFVLTAEKVAR